MTQLSKSHHLLHKQKFSLITTTCYKNKEKKSHLLKVQSFHFDAKMQMFARFSAFGQSFPVVISLYTRINESFRHFKQLRGIGQDLFF